VTHPRGGSVLVTGGAGFVGANFVRFWLDSHARDRVTVLDSLTYAGNRESLAPFEKDDRFRFVHASIGDLDAVRRVLSEQAVDVIVHFAAESHVDRSISAPDVFLETNVLGTHALLKAARERWESLTGAVRDRFRFHHVSTDEVFGSLGADDPAFTERTPYAPNSPYAASKAASDHLVRAYNRTYGLPVTTSNCSNNYGPLQFPEKLIPLTLVNSMEGKPLPVYGDGLNRRDWLHVEDHCRGIALVLEKGVSGECYNIGGGTEVANIDLVRALCRRVDARFASDGALRARYPHSPAARGGTCESLIEFVTDRLGHDRRYAIDGTRATNELGYRPARTLEQGLDETVDWYLANEGWWGPLYRRRTADGGRQGSDGGRQGAHGGRKGTDGGRQGTDGAAADSA
jgi:dTDP-glucose 4,6-dehydratase